MEKILYKCRGKTEFDRVRTIFARLGVEHEIRKHCIIADKDSLAVYNRIRKKDGIIIEEVEEQVDKTGTNVYL